MAPISEQTTNESKSQLETAAPGAGSFENCPVEVIETIARFLDDEAIFAFRSTCRYVAKYTHSYFAQRYMHTIPTDFFTESLERLRQISMDPDFASSTKTLVVKPTDVNQPAVFPREEVIVSLRRQPRLLPCEQDILGEGFRWDHLENGFLDLDQQAVGTWCEMLIHFANMRSFCMSPDSSTSIHSSCGVPGELTTCDALVIILHYISKHNINVVSLDLSLSNFYPPIPLHQRCWEDRSYSDEIAEAKQARCLNLLPDASTGYTWPSHHSNRSLSAQDQCPVQTRPLYSAACFPPRRTSRRLLCVGTI
ncbi:hypothetical protein BJY01DRAFT_256146 [Aspergillus pseudoustus]|uniref:F-box domain-containing protein n=1 Tax=Aspergillus pseudoustus TaxID=1810923 RepID=A0ABR4IE29_9EURO